MKKKKKKKVVLVDGEEGEGVEAAADEMGELAGARAQKIAGRTRIPYQQK